MCTQRIHNSIGGVGERSNPSDCKSDASASQVRILPPPPKVLHLKQNLSIKPFGATGVESYFFIYFSYAVSYDFKGIAHIAQLVEHFLGKEEVTGSSPVMSSIK